MGELAAELRNDGREPRENDGPRRFEGVDHEYGRFRKGTPAKEFGKASRDDGGSRHGSTRSIEARPEEQVSRRIDTAVRLFESA